MTTTPHSRIAAETIAPVAWQSAVMEIVGPAESTHILGAQPAPWQGALERLQQRYGVKPGLGVGWRIGRAFARYALVLAAEEAGFRAPDFRFLPWPRKMPEGMQRLARLTSQWFGVEVRVTAAPDAVYWHAGHCPFGRVEHPCTPWMGFLQEALYGLSGGHWFAVQSEPDARCVLRVPRRPVY